MSQIPLFILYQRCNFFPCPVFLILPSKVDISFSCYWNNSLFFSHAAWLLSVSGSSSVLPSSENAEKWQRKNGSHWQNIKRQTKLLPNVPLHGSRAHCPGIALYRIPLYRIPLHMETLRVSQSTKAALRLIPLRISPQQVKQWLSLHRRGKRENLRLLHPGNSRTEGPSWQGLTLSFYSSPSLCLLYHLLPGNSASLLNTKQ